MVFLELDELFGDGKYEGIAPEKPTYGWTGDHVLWAMEAVTASAKTYEAMGEMPEVFIIFTMSNKPLSYTDTELEECNVILNTPMQGLEEHIFLQWIAYEMAHCMIPKTFPAQVSLGYEVTKWWQEGLALWLSAVAYPALNVEWWEFLVGGSPALANLEDTELHTTLLDRSWTNWPFFAHAQEATALDLIRSLPPPPSGGGRAAQEDALAEYEGIDRLFHKFAEGLTDESIPDPESFGETVPYDARAHTVPISQPTVVWNDPKRFGVVRMYFVVDPGKYACIEYKEEGELRSSWRTGEPGAPGGSWSEDLPKSLDGEAVFVVTATETGAEFTAKVTDVDDDPDCEEEEEESEPEPCPIELECPPSEYYNWENWELAD
jgi:hypothetical protein